MTIPRLIAVIDYEASGFRGYPIEVGVAIYDPARTYLSLWSTLIRPTQAWLETMPWSDKAETIHCIARDALDAGETPGTVAAILNRLLAPIGIAYCDGGGFDTHWNALLMGETLEPPSFVLDSIDTLSRRLGFRAVDVIHADGPAVHRAGPDAERTLRRALELAGLVQYVPARFRTDQAEPIILALRANEAELRRAGVRHLSLFGSFARGDARAGSEIELAAELDGAAHRDIFHVTALERRIAEILDQPVDLVAEPVDSQRYQVNINRDRRRAF